MEVAIKELTDTIRQTYELTPILSIIASASATIVAIIGGFVASRLISLSTERSEVELKNSEILDELTFLNGKITDGQNKIDEEDALTLIDVKLRKLINQIDLREFYEDVRGQDYLCYEKMLKYWERALTICRRFKACLDKLDSLNADNIPVGLAQECNNRFDYEVCKMIAEGIACASQTFAYKTTKITGLWYRDLENEVSELRKKVQWLKIQSKQLAVREKVLKKPKGMIAGLLLLILFSFTGIILPVIHLNIIINDYQVYNQLRYTFIGYLCVNLMLTFLYFIYLLKWKKSVCRTRRK